MSLLLDALKKAELAKQIARAEGAAEAPAPEPAPAEPVTPVITRAKLPDIAEPLEILGDDLSRPDERGREAQASRPELSLQDSELAASATRLPPYASESERSAEQNRAQQLFQVKEMDYNPRRPFYLTLTALALAGLSYGGYVWWQTRPQQSYAVAAVQSPVQSRLSGAPAQPTAPPIPAAVPQQPGATPPASAPQAAAAPVPARAAIPQIPPIQPTRPPRAGPRPSRAVGAVPSREPRPRATPEPGGSAASRAAETFGPIAINAPALSVDPLLEQAYRALQRNDLATARQGYQRVLAREPSNRDALLGLAAIEVRSGRLDAAEAHYLRLLEMDPRDTQAVANLIALRGPLDPVASESRLKTLIATQPEAAPLHFSLGNQYARQSRWSEAQAAYFKAHSVDPGNADYAFNLAVSLDQLRQKKLALEFYQRALVLADQRAASFNPVLARGRVQELSKVPSP